MFDYLQPVTHFLHSFINLPIIYTSSRHSEDLNSGFRMWVLLNNTTTKHFFTSTVCLEMNAEAHQTPALFTSPITQAIISFGKL